MYKELAQYVAPKRKAVEMKADLGLTWIDVLKEINAREQQAKANQSGTAWVHHIVPGIALERDVSAVLGETANPLS